MSDVEVRLGEWAGSGIKSTLRCERYTHRCIQRSLKGFKQGVDVTKQAL